MIEIEVIFTDLDGTLLDDEYSSDLTLPLLSELKERDIPVVFCSSKTRAEQEILRERLGIEDPFIVEDGSAILIPVGYFGEDGRERQSGFNRLVLGIEYEKIVDEIDRLRERYRVVSYSNMTVDEVAGATGLDIERARLAMRREFSETVVDADEGAIEELKRKFSVALGGDFVQIFGKGSDKGRAVSILSDMYRERFEVTTIGIGNSYNDEPMLRAVDRPAIVKNPDGSWADIEIEEMFRAQGVGPQGWTEVVRRFIV